MAKTRKNSTRSFNSAPKASPSVEEAMLGLKMEFGNQAHLEIAKDYSEIVKLTTELAATEERLTEVKRLTKKVGELAKTIGDKEANLIYRLELINKST